MTDSKAVKNNPFKEIGKSPSMKYSGEYSLKNIHDKINIFKFILSLISYLLNLFFFYHFKKI